MTRCGGQRIQVSSIRLAGDAGGAGRRRASQDRCAWSRRLQAGSDRPRRNRVSEPEARTPPGDSISRARFEVWRELLPPAARQSVRPGGGELPSHLSKQRTARYASSLPARELLDALLLMGAGHSLRFRVRRQISRCHPQSCFSIDSAKSLIVCRSEALWPLPNLRRRQKELRVDEVSPAPRTRLGVGSWPANRGKSDNCWSACKSPVPAK